MATMTITLPDEMRDYVEKLVATDGYASVSDVLRNLIDDRIRQNEALYAALVEGSQSGDSGKSLDDIVAAGIERHR